jgi:glycosyltransferase involved in cell wall biosynthesis
MMNSGLALSKDRNFLFTVGIPVRNGMPWLRDSIESLRVQTFADFEVLVILDGPDPESRAYLETISDLHLRVLEQPPLGLVPTLNRLLEEVATPWLVRQDADDISYPHRMQRLQDAIQTHAEVGVIYSQARYYSAGRAVGCFRSSLGSPAELRRIVQSGHLLSICHSSAVLHVARTRSAGGYRTIPFAEDADLWWRMALLYDLYCIREPLVGFRQNDASVSARNLHAQQLSGLYVQYLLLSFLWGLPPRPLEEVQASLAPCVSIHRLDSKRLLRNMNSALAHHRYLDAVRSLFRACFVDPAYISRRTWDEVHPSRLGNGLPPKDFWERKHLLWA